MDHPDTMASLRNRTGLPIPAYGPDFVTQAPIQADFSKPLPDQKSLRLLHVMRTESASPALTFRLETFSLDSAPPYAAISYTWGRPFLHNGEPIDFEPPLIFDHTISIDERPFLITR